MKTNTIELILLGLFCFGTVFGGDIAEYAKNQIRRSDWAYGNTYITSTFTVQANTYKSHLFVYDVLNNCNANPPMRYGMHGGCMRGMHHMMMGCNMPIGPSEWGNMYCSYMNSCWNLCTSVRQIDDIISDGTRVAIVTGDQLTTSAMTDVVEETDWGFRSAGDGSEQSITACWRHTC
ncbi:uncharacterized protein LOC123561300 [Mercenaria mercenaria]|uniref:uncharacterized protein LOC123561300 n=1 Tax=Mercenaria mercenaria TaxID=6596 RepID=UPI00234E4B95|nr:uncharacterized protein LOC123561300 [Mercenaria mercenaria]